MPWASFQDAAAACELAAGLGRGEASRLRSVLMASRSQLKDGIARKETDRLRQLLGIQEPAKHDLEKAQRLSGTATETRNCLQKMPAEQVSHCDINSTRSSRDASSEQSEESFVLLNNASVHGSSASSRSSSSWSKVSELGAERLQLEAGRKQAEPGIQASCIESSGSSIGQQRPKKLSGRTRQRLAKWRREVRQRTPSPDCLHAAIKQHLEG
eukprot:TRINITY_DN9167_c0_g1_i3.p1 TRINITY_DN9167_c0_g1~~TRINITY_DN9167_c0_g1_i3.p1  ORF type:complete len:230 (+),score=53.33 TRINITY_DN9167_c0_g1_i3:52-690(+)